MTTLIFNLNFPISHLEFIKNYLNSVINNYEPESPNQSPTLQISLLNWLDKVDSEDFYLLDFEFLQLKEFMELYVIEHKINYPKNKLPSIVDEILIEIKRSNNNWRYGSYSTHGDEGDD